MKSTDFQSHESRERVEELLRAAAAWEPEQPAPEGLAARALAAETARRQGERARRPRARRLAFWGLAFGGLAGAGACASLALGLMQRPPAVVVVTPTPHLVSAPAHHPAAKNREFAPVMASTPLKRSQPAVQLAASVTRGVHHPHRSGAREPAPRVRWQEAPPPDEPSPVLAPGWLVEDKPDGTLIATPGVIAIPVNACAPPDGAEEPTASPAPAAPSDPSNEPLEKTDHDKDTH